MHYSDDRCGLMCPVTVLLQPICMWLGKRTVLIVRVKTFGCFWCQQSHVLEEKGVIKWSFLCTHTQRTVVSNNVYQLTRDISSQKPEP